jgi:histidyl-tRNA synthetase
MSLPGFRDFYPDDCAFRNAIFAKWRDVAHRYGFVEYDGPPLEPLDLFTKKSGQEIVGQLYNFKDKGDREVALRPEMTPTLARLVTARHKDFKKPLKWFSIPQVYRYERPQKGRGREHYQFNCDIIGEASLEADVELIALAIDTLRAFGLTEKDFVVRLSDRQFWTDFMDAHGVPEDQRYGFIQAIDKSEREPREKTAEKLNSVDRSYAKSGSVATGEPVPGDDEIFDRRPLADTVFEILDDATVRKSDRLDTVEAGLRHRGLGDFVKRDYTVVRGLAYYTGVVFEAFDRSGEFRAIAGGGRYDTLLKNLGGVDLPALGFGMGDVVLGEILKAKQRFQPLLRGGGISVIIADEKYRPEAMLIVQRLRDLNIDVDNQTYRFIQAQFSKRPFPVDYPLSPTKIGKQFQTAEDNGNYKAVIVDAKILQGEVEVKNLHTRDQITLKVEELTFETLFPSKQN